MRINHNISALNTWQSQQKNQSATQATLEKLSSGMRINKAGDDAAGLAISEKMRGQIRGLGQASRNIQDGISLIQTAEGGLNEIHALLQRGRELSVQAASDTNTEDDRKQLQKEMDQLVKEVDRISQTTEFNTISLLNKDSSSPAGDALTKKLKNQWLKNSTDRITAQYGLTPDNAQLSINVVQGAAGGKLAYVTSYGTGSPGIGNNLSLTVEMADYDDATQTIGGLSADRTIAHEMAHAVMARTMNWSGPVNASETTGIATWFREGTAELIHGADERVAGDLAALGNNKQALVDLLGNAGDPWVSDSAHYSTSFLAVRYMHDAIKDAGGNGIKDVMAYLSGDPTRSLDDAIKSVATANSIAAWSSGVSGFKSDFKANGANFAAYGIDLANSDTGAIGGADADGGSVLTDTSVIADTVNASVDSPFTEIYPAESGSTVDQLVMHIGANTNQSLNISLSNAGSKALGIDQIDLVTDANSSISTFDEAINTVSAQRSRLGAIQNRLEHALNISQNYEENLTASESRIRDADVAKEMMSFTKNNILSQASMAMLAQANQSTQGALMLLR